MSIVERQFPQGDQFLFITARDGREIAVDFVDPDADSTGSPPVKVRRKPEDLQLETLILDPHGERAEMTYLAAELERVRARLPQWLEQKEAGLEEMRDPSFWDSPDRHVALGRIEYLDRLEAATATAERLFSRLARREKGTGAAAADLVSMLAQRLHVLNRALEGLETGDPSDAVLAIRVPPTTGKNTDAASSFADDLASMYRSWSDRRGMRIRELESQAADDHVFVVAGLGAYTILKHEAGLHVLELPLDNRKFARVPVMVNIAPFQQVDGISAHDQARRALADAGSSRTVVRRYRTGPSPLVRDSRGWRSGHLDAVLAGDFDVMG
jgi:ATP-dependent Clp protease ATP-binding subunit ClpC